MMSMSYSVPFLAGLDVGSPEGFLGIRQEKG